MNEINEEWSRLEEENLEHYEIGNQAHFRDYESKQEPKEIRYWKNKDGYNYVGLFVKGHGNKKQRQRIFRLARLVAKYFIPNPDNIATVNHKIGKDDDSAENLEWATRRQQILYQDKRKTCSSQFKGVSKLPSGNFIARFWNTETKKLKNKTFKKEEEAGNWWDERMKEFYKNSPDGKFIIINNPTNVNFS